MAALAGGEGLPDIMNAGIDYIGGYVDKFPDAFVDLSTYGANNIKSDFPAGMIKSASRDGKLSDQRCRFGCRSAGNFMRQAMSSFPASITEAARIDGAGELRIFGTIVLPAMKPTLAALAIFMFLGRWNDFVYPLVITRTPEQYTIPVALASLQGVGTTDYGQLLSGTAIAVLPVLVLFVFLQKQFVSGMVAGSVKE
ncbi:carbohydrate ABC transporter permease [Bifidobacterium sp.]|uniref:carbohydrate ABC transporter permease n=2 Tax=Bifidobacterium sp. TaxID=41200 RepID=UPI0025B8B2D9|nr:ABC transporter permease subunit [Bifidobacterium sp.]MCH4209487.1 ABC transporter permease subunit [Bifidobacterium sp.]